MTKLIRDEYIKYLEKEIEEQCSIESLDSQNLNSNPYNPNKGLCKTREEAVQMISDSQGFVDPYFIKDNMRYYPIDTKRLKRKKQILRMWKGEIPFENGAC